MTTPSEPMSEPTQDIIDEFVGNAHGNLDRVRELLTAYPSVLNANASWTETAIEAATQVNRADIISYLLEAGAPLDICTAAVLGQRERVAALLDAEPAQAHATGAHHIPVLYFPTVANQVEIAEVLLARGANVNAGVGGTTPLHGAALFGEAGMAAWLLEHGADPNARNHEHKTALRVALDRDHAEVARVLREHGAAEEAPAS